MSAEIRKMLSAHDKGMSLSEDVLSRLFRKMLLDNNMEIYHWNSLSDKYLNDPTNRIPQDPSTRASARGNLNKELASTRMTWNVFNKALKFLGPEEAVVTIELVWNKNRATKHFIIIPFFKNVIHSSTFIDTLKEEAGFLDTDGLIQGDKMTVLTTQNTRRRYLSSTDVYDTDLPVQSILLRDDCRIREDEPLTLEVSPHVTQ